VDWVTLETQMGSTRLEISKDPKGVYPKMPVQLFQEEGFKKTNLRQLLFQNFNLEEEQLRGNERHCR
jgi:hypothetical protein